MILDEGLEELASRFAADVTLGQWGTGTAVPSATDTGLGSAIPDTLIALTSTSSGNSSQFTHEVSSAEGNGFDLTEHELEFDNNVSFNRSLGGPISKTASFELTTLVTVSFVRQ